ncbi:hypothetical protein ONA91_26335 [Micromonospora sp. DR5-3]|uniref:molybdopterin dinucleotide binding domain-containing protein n=1 Tax=unclassified Micromonospora TaxID=2617518 RepID=UPI001CA32D4B|nr:MULTISPECIES: molybdopterin dinucleotide binding domain-containing protein [unclassified Micromonospora]MCW3817973.1 hypothetical protein [Micromonospora sp. DR5-3]
MSRRTPNHQLRPDEVLDLHPDDAARLGLSDGDLVQVTSRRATVTFPVHLTDTIAPGQMFTAFNFPDTPTNALTSDATDTETGCPEYKITAVSLSPLRIGRCPYRAPARAVVDPRQRPGTDQPDWVHLQPTRSRLGNGGLALPAAVVSG